MLSENIKRLRKQKGLSQDKLAKLADITLTTLVKIESGANDNPTIKTLKKIADALEVTVNDLLENQPDKPDSD
ncbi:MAG TPA: XRE family transcriptional regulator [Spirochaetales bacterium]|nr:XRE family transcriptional regulator [Spirochaetales bacterium]